MMVDETELEEVFAKHELCLAYVDHRTGDLGFSRPCEGHQGLFEIVEIKHAGRELNVVSASVGVSCVRGRFSWKGLSRRSCVLEVASNKERGQTALNSKTDTDRWVQQLDAIIPEQLVKIRQQFAAGLEQQTDQARLATQRYLKAMGFPCTVALAQEKLSQKIKPADVLQALEALCHQVGWAAQPTYHYVAVLAVCSLSSEVEPNTAFEFQDPSNDTQLMWRMNMIADELMSFPKPMTIVFSGNSSLGYSVREPLVGQKR